MALHLPINAECNIQCVFCSSAGRNGDFVVADLCREIDEDTTGHVQISGGDPLLREPAALLEILLHCKKKGKIIEFQTNAVLATTYDRKVFTMIVKLADFFNVNFSAPNPEVDFAVTQVRDGFARRIEGIKLIHSLGGTVRLTYIVCQANVAHCKEFVDLVHDTLPEVKWIQFSYVKGMGRAKGNKRIMPKFEEAAPPLNAAMKRCTEIGVDFEVDHIPVCFVMDYKDKHVDYNKMRREVQGIYIEEKQQVKACDGCNIRAHCPGPRKDYVEVYGTL
jgi:MoaA/NifB/PqqE/SkfB family radical SAM enzyme